MSIFGIGIDLCSIARVEKIYAKYGRKLEWRILCPVEQELEEPTAQRIARRIAAKEAISKALGCGIGEKLSFQDIRILRKPSGQPYVVLSDEAKGRFPNIEIHLSITEEEGVAGASALAVQL